MAMPMPGDNNSERLQQLNQGKATLITIFNDSLPASIANFNVRVRRLLRMIHFDLAIPLLAVSGFTIIAAWFMINAKNSYPDKPISVVGVVAVAAGNRVVVPLQQNRPSDRDPASIFAMARQYDLVRDLATLIGASITIQFAILSLHRDYHQKQLQRSSDYMQHWFSQLEAADIQLNEFIAALEDGAPMAPTDAVLFNIYHSRYSELKRSADGIDQLKRLQTKILIALCRSKTRCSLNNVGDPGPIDPLHKVLNFFENVGLDIKNNVVDPDYLKEYFYSTVIDYYELFRKYIEFAQFSNNSRQILCNFVYLAQTWEREGVRPAIPRICIRPLVLTQADIAAVQDHSDSDA